MLVACRNHLINQFVSGEKAPDHFQSEEEAHNECKSKRVTKDGRVISYVMSPVPKLEPALPRRKKHPDLAYRHHEFLPSDGVDGRARVMCTFHSPIIPFPVLLGLEVSPLTYTQLPTAPDIK